MVLYFNYLKDDWDSPFYKSTISKWKYKGEEFNNVEVNYIAGGHVMHHFGIPSDDAWFLVCKWKSINYQVDPTVETPNPRDALLRMCQLDSHD